MTPIKEIEKAITHLPDPEYREFRAWFEEFDAQNWDAEMERDAASGKLDKLADDARRDYKNGRCSSL